MKQRWSRSNRHPEFNSGSISKKMLKQVQYDGLHINVPHRQTPNPILE